MARIATWSLFALLALAWTGGAWGVAALGEWAAGAIAQGGVVDAGRQLAAVPVPTWIAPWIDPALLQAAQSAILWAVNHGQAVLPYLGAAAGWLVPLVWVVWGFGFAALLATAATAHWALGRWTRRPQPA